MPYSVKNSGDPAADSLGQFFRGWATVRGLNANRESDQAQAGLDEAKMVGETKKNDFIANMSAGNFQDLPGDTLAQRYALHGLSAPELSSVQGNTMVAPFRTVEEQALTPTAVGQSMINKNEEAAIGGITDAEQSKLNFNQEKDLRGEYTKSTGDFAKLNDSWAKINSSLAAGTAAGDHAGIFAYMKMLDPTSTVREGEFATVENTGSVPNRVWSAYNKAKKGTLMTPTMREDFLSTAGNIYNDAYDIYEKRGAESTTLAESYGLNPDNVVYNRAMHDRYTSPDPTPERVEGMSDEERWNQLEALDYSKDEIITIMTGE